MMARFPGAKQDIRQLWEAWKEAKRSRKPGAGEMVSQTINSLSKNIKAGTAKLGIKPKLDLMKKQREEFTLSNVDIAKQTSVDPPAAPVVSLSPPKAKENPAELTTKVI